MNATSVDRYTREVNVSLKRLLIALGVGAAVFAVGQAVVTIVDAKNYAQPVGQLHVATNRDYQAAIVQYEESHRAPISCAVHLYGYDNKYLYSDVMCATYSGAHTPNAKLESSYELPGRYEYTANPLRIVNHTYVGDGDMKPTAKELFPQAIYYQYRQHAALNDLQTELDQKARQ